MASAPAAAAALSCATASAGHAALCMVLCSLVAACRGVPRDHDEIVLLNEAVIARLDPRFVSTAWEARVSHLVAPGLVDLAERGLGTVEGLAESVTREDAHSYVARLRPGVRFSDGTPVTADDVKYTFDSVRDPLLGGLYRKVWDQYLVAVEILDERTVRFRLRQPRAPFATDLDFGIVSRRHAEPRDEALRAAARAGARPPPFDPVREVIGAGSYRVAARSADVVTLVRNEHSRFPPITPKLTIRTIRDDNARVLALLGGSADVILNVVTPAVVETLESNPKLKVVYGPSATLTYVGFNVTAPIVGQRKIRRAIAHALDRERLIAAKYRGRARLARSPLDEGNPFFDAGLPGWRFDPALARRLLDEAGFPDPDGDGPGVRFTLSWRTSSIRFRVALAQAMARQLREVGIGIDVRPFELATLLHDLRKGGFQLFTLQLTDVVEPDMLRALLHSSRIPAEESSWSGLNKFRYRDAALDRLLDEAAAESDPEARRRLYVEVQQIVARELPLLPLWHEENMMAYSRALEAPSADLTVSKIGRLEELLVVRKTPRAPQP
jgi:peptide/nickel transport system substrate-binding protein